ncbi:alpha/beta fold hydrolase [Galbitalea soli]|uniref:Alpha/beta hydrolase n=1 Tax=Galbitalea soli TaxID=1268042 RepID=A0A7C9PMW6_9MICO|nr:alpha/beta hydrolase [Galbitalea soli]NEM91107.1 alpha/beta hydrolase [Galbitalea soli]NYJ29795.1 pimeloyl-ACP methyl ester carboxylesterase [Galbitalea soli]
MEFEHVRGLAADLGTPEPVTLPERTRVTVGDRDISMVAWGTDAVVTAFHGGGLNAHSWDATLLHLDLSAVAFDLPGHGHSSWRTDARYTPETLAADLGPALHSLHLTSQVVVGHSIGALTGLLVAAQNPELAAALVMIDATPSPDPTAMAAVRRIFAGPSSFESYEEAARWATGLGLGTTAASLEQGLRFNMREREDGRVVFRHHLAHLEPDASAPAWDESQLWSAAASLAVPLLIIRGTHGFVSEADAARFADHCANARIVTIDGGHNVHHNSPGAVAAAIRSFADEIGVLTPHSPA